MPPRRFVAHRGLALLAAVTLAVVACACAAQVSPTATPTPTSSPTERATPAPTPSPTPTPEPTPRFTNPPDEELEALLPSEVAGVPVVVARSGSYGLTPGDVGLVFGELGVRFQSLAVAYVEQPRVSLYAVRADGPVSNDDLAPHLATAGRYLGIAGLEREPWERMTVGGHEVWTRPGDEATAAGTVLYTWAADDLVFLLIGVDDRVNRALVAALPGEPAATPRPAGSTPPSSPLPSASDD